MGFKGRGVVVRIVEGKLSVKDLLNPGCGAAPPRKFDRSAHEQTRLLAAGESWAQKVLQRLSGNEQGAILHYYG